VTTTATTVVAEWNAIPQFSFPPSINRTVRLTLDATTNTITLDNYLIAGLGGGYCGIGISPGTPIATDPGPVSFVSELAYGLVPGWPLATDATYEHSLTGMVNVTGITSIMFIPNANGNYDRITM
jgi:hypothetical protein